ncbi:hypothetical protein Y032_0125g1301 [Ancylostoma ceylanicum]|uniref:Coiled-coil domain-containing protein n=1 Tax=Ancylostoma ceylanicum TaxID=53326 RepID=A0A016T910_9BILA|nr:hypothetical protein Y032_0125g1301 [Ancylostoma ceylanicum]
MEEKKKSVAEDKVIVAISNLLDYAVLLKKIDGLRDCAIVAEPERGMRRERAAPSERVDHYNRNREGRRLVGDDTKQSIIEQAHEDEAARQRRLEALKKITETDEEIARRLQLEFEQEEKRRLEEVARRDAELAQRLAQIEGQSTSVSSNTIPSRQVQTSPGNQIQPPPLIDLSEDLSTTNPIHAVPTQPKVLQLPPTGSIPGPSTGYGWSVPTTEAHQAPEQAAPIPLHPTNPFLQDLSVPQPSGSTPY